MYDGTTTIMTIRHGETEFNRQKRYAGLLDVSLNRKGIQDCRLAAQRFEEPYDLIVTSRLKRAVETARLLVGKKPPIIECALCNERNFGAMQGRTAEEVETIRPDIRYVKIGNDFHSLNPPQGESLPGVHRRARQFLAYLLAQGRGIRILVVSHEVFLQEFHGVLRGESWREALCHRVPSLTLSTFTLRGARLLHEQVRSFVADGHPWWHLEGA